MSESTLLLVRMAGSLVVVVVLLWVLVKLARSRGLGGAGQDLIAVRAQRGLNRSTSLMLVQVGSRNLLLGVADGGVQVLSEGDALIATRTVDEAPGGFDDEADEPITISALASVQPSSRGLLNRLRDRTVRRQR
ncbi:MAG: flagellar biosynthetic protein FliO [Acidimicrobiia bacterium]|nr:flagellar biosynthetic protein FliO [Acidimicrobiia bacterium]